LTVKPELPQSPLHHGFLPDPARGQAADETARMGLWSSLDHIAEACADPLPEITKLLQAPLGLLAQGAHLPPEAYGLYYHLGENLLRDRPDEALSAARQLALIGAREKGLSHAARGHAGLIDEVLDLRMGEEAEKFHPITPEAADDFWPLVQDGLALLRAGVPELAGEIEAILSRFLFAQAPPGAKMEFDGASHFQFWGLLLLNPRHHRTPLALAEVLAHEAGHSLLFGLTVHEPLVLNPDHQRYASPLRVDLRPMDGIYHATFVSARMAFAMERLADSGVLTAAEAEQARKEAAKDRDNFEKGLSVVAADGDLTETGRAIMDNATAWIRTGRG